MSEIYINVECFKCKEELESDFDGTTIYVYPCCNCSEHKNEVILLMRTLKDDTEENEVIGVFTGKEEIEKAIQKYIKYIMKTKDPKIEFVGKIKTDGNFTVVEKSKNVHFYFQTIELTINNT